MTTYACSAQMVRPSSGSPGRHRHHHDCRIRQALCRVQGRVHFRVRPPHNVLLLHGTLASCISHPLSQSMRSDFAHDLTCSADRLASARHYRCPVWLFIAIGTGSWCCKPRSTGQTCSCSLQRRTGAAMLVSSLEQAKELKVESR